MMILEDAERLAKRLYRVQRKRQEIEGLFEEEIEKLKAELYDIIEQQKTAVKPLTDEIEYLQRELKTFHMSYFAETGAKTVRLPHATLSCRKKSQDYLKDEEALFEWVQANAADFVKQAAPSIAWGELKKQLIVAGDKVLLQETGEIVDGLTPKPVEIEYKVEVVG